MQTPTEPCDAGIADPREWLEANVPRVTQLVAQTARRRRLAAQDRDELLSLLWTHLTHDDYRVLRRFRGTSNIVTYLTVVIERLLLDWRTAAWGKWRPSSRARRLGTRAIAFERLVLRDGHSSDQAHTLLRHATGATLPQDLAAALVSRSPRRRRQFVELKDVIAAHAPSADPWSVLVGKQHARSGLAIARHLERALATLPAADQVLLRMRHEEGLKVTEIAAMLGVDQKKLYRRLEAVHADMRHMLTALGVSRREAIAVASDYVTHVPPVLNRIRAVQ